MGARSNKDAPITVEVQDGRPVKVQGLLVSHILGHYCIWHNWWEGQKLRTYWKLTVESETIEIYQTDDGWFFFKDMELGPL